jgi:predicted amidohydrolase
MKEIFARLGILLLAGTAAIIPLSANAAQSYEDVITVATVNFPTTWGDKAANLETMEKYITEAAKKGTNLILFPEQALTGYDSGGDEKMHWINAETIPGPTTEEIAKLSGKYDMWVVFGMPERDPTTSAVYNSVAIVGPDGTTISYRKINTALDEPLWCEHGSKPVVFETEWGPVGVGICYDNYAFPGIVRYSASRGARIHLNSTAAGVPDMGSLNSLTF